MGWCKTQLIDQLEALLPADFNQWENVTYIEPFIGQLLQKVELRKLAAYIAIY